MYEPQPKLKHFYLSLLFIAFVPAVFALDAEAVRNANKVTDALFKNYWNQDRQDFGPNNYWFYAHSIEIAAMVFTRNSSSESRQTLNMLISAQKKRGFLQGKDVYFDDEAWMAISLARSYEVTGRTEYLEIAAALLEDILKRGTQGRSEGVWWNSEHQKVATAANAGSVIAAALIGRLTNNQVYLGFAKKNYHFWRTTMVDNQTFLIFDQILGSAEIDRTPWSYDQGLMVGAAVELFRLTGEVMMSSACSLFFCCSNDFVCCW